MNKKQSLSLNERILNEICDELNLLEGQELDDFLNEIGLAPNELLQNYENNANGATVAMKRSKFDEALQQVRNQQRLKSSKVVSFDTARKQQILAAIKKRTTDNKDMTMAARNQKIDAESDLDCFLDGCFRLGVIDEDGNLI